MKVKGFILYRIYYDSGIVYLGRTKQNLTDRIRGHVFVAAMHRKIDINKIEKIEYSIFKSAADMNIYEIYFINTLKPMLNADDKEMDKVSVVLPDIEWNIFECHLMNKWKSIILNDIEIQVLRERRKEINNNELKSLRKSYRAGEISKDACSVAREILAVELDEIEKKLFG